MCVGGGGWFGAPAAGYGRYSTLVGKIPCPATSAFASHCALPAACAAPLHALSAVLGLHGDGGFAGGSGSW